MLLQGLESLESTRTFPLIPDEIQPAQRPQATSGSTTGVWSMNLQTKANSS